MNFKREFNEVDPEFENFIYGKDELNLAEFPLAALSKRVSPHTKTLQFSDKIRDKMTGQLLERKLTITASDKFGLPTALDDEVVLALIQLSKLQGFHSKTVPYTRYEILKILGWKNNGQNYRRIQESLERWLNVGLKYEKAWWNPQEKTWMDESFHILDRLSSPTNDKGHKTHCFVWNEVVFESLQRGNLKSLDFGFYRRLNSPIAKRLFRFLDKNFHFKSSWEFDLTLFALQKLGMSKSYHTGVLKQKLSPAIQELEEIGFLTPMTKSQRFQKVASKSWKILFQGDKPPKSPAGFLVKSIEEDYQTPVGFKTQETLLQEQETRQQKLQLLEASQERKKRRQEEKRVRDETQARERERATQTYLKTLTEKEREKVIAQAITTGNPGMLKLDGKSGRIYRKQLLQDYVLKLLTNTSTSPQT